MTAAHSIAAFTPDPDCTLCGGDGLVCEDHPDRPWDVGDGCCGAAGMPCACNRWPCGSVGAICSCVMRVYTCTDHDCVWPTGVAAVVVAANEHDAREQLDAVLRDKNLKTYGEAPYTLTELVTRTPCAVILCDGDY